MPQKRFCACVGREADAITGDISEADALLQSKLLTAFLHISCRRHPRLCRLSRSPLCRCERTKLSSNCFRIAANTFASRWNGFIVALCDASLIAARSSSSFRAGSAVLVS